MPVYFLYQEGHGPDRIKIGRARRVEDAVANCRPAILTG